MFRHGLSPLRQLRHDRPYIRMPCRLKDVGKTTADLEVAGFTSIHAKPFMHSHVSSAVPVAARPLSPADISRCSLYETAAYVYLLLCLRYLARPSGLCTSPVQ